MITVTHISAELIMFEYKLYNFTCFYTKLVKGISVSPLIYYISEIVTLAVHCVRMSEFSKEQ